MLYIMRHGKTDWNAAHRLQGRTDVPLNIEGKLQAAKAAELYSGVHLDVCYCSPLSRARETAEIFLRGRNIPIIEDARLTEMCFGVCEGAENSFPATDGPMKTFFRNPAAYVPPEGAESFAELFARTGDFLNSVIYPLLKEGKDVLIVGHGAMNSSIVCSVKDIPLENFWNSGLDSCKLTKLL